MSELHCSLQTQVILTKAVLFLLNMTQRYKLQNINGDDTEHSVTPLVDSSWLVYFKNTVNPAWLNL